MKNLIILALLSLFALSAKASEYYLYGSLQASREYRDSGSDNDRDSVSFTNDLKDQPYGIGAEMRFEKDETDDFFLGAGLHYQAPSDAKNNVNDISLGHVYFNAYSKVSKAINLFIGAQYTLIDLDSDSDYDIENGLGVRIGADFELPKSFGAQIYYRNLYLDSEAENGYEGDLNLSSLIASLGYRF